MVAELATGNTWRIGVDPAERTELVVHGPFSLVRNPIFAAMIPSFTGIALLAPNPVTLTGAILLMLALELQTRLIEEPYLSEVHGEQYAVYAGRVGRFFPSDRSPAAYQLCSARRLIDDNRRRTTLTCAPVPITAFRYRRPARPGNAALVSAVTMHEEPSAGSIWKVSA